MTTDTDIIAALDHWEHEAKEAQRNFKSMQAQSNQLRDEVWEQSKIIDNLKAENAELRAGQGRWPEKGGEVLIDNTDYVPWGNLPKYAENHVKALREVRRELKDLHMAMMELKPASESTVPRVISAEELRVGQVAVIHDEERNSVVGGLVSRVESGGGIMRFRGHGETIFDLDRSEVDTIVLLEDTPSDDDGAIADQWQKAQAMYSHAIMPDGRIINYDQAKHIKDGDPETKPAPRLTVHALNTAPVGSTVSTPGKTRTKRDDGTWFTVSAFGQHTRTSEELLALGYANATLTHPERGDDEQP